MNSFFGFHPRVGYVLSLVASVLACWLLLAAPFINILICALLIWCGGCYARQLGR